MRSAFPSIRAFLLVTALICSATALAQGAPQVVINEIMQNPAAVNDSAGEWFELHNMDGAPVDINGWTIADNDSDSHLIDNGGPLVIPAGGFLVLGNNTDMGTNGGVNVAYSYGGSFFLSNSADELVLFQNNPADGLGVEIDRVEWDNGVTFPDPNGASMALINPALDNNVGSNWCTSSMPFGAGDLGTPGAPNDCLPVGPTDPLINEFVNNHTGTDTNEYIEVLGDASTDYSAYTLLEIEGDASSNEGTIDEVITVGMTSADGYWFTGFGNNVVENGTVTLLLVETFSGMAGDDLDTNDDGTPDATPWARIVDCVGVFDGSAGDLNYCSTVLDSTLQGSGGFTPGGASRIPDGTDTDSATDWVTNDFDGAGIPALDPGSPDSGEALNTPDAVNALVPKAGPPQIVINEIMQNPSAVADDAGEWIELYNAGPSTVDIDGWTIADNDTDSHVINAGGPLNIPAGGYVILGNNANSATNGGIAVDYEYAEFFLSNGADEVVLFDGTLPAEGGPTEIDRVEYDGGATFPDPTGASMALVDPVLDNNVGANWCESSTEIPPPVEVPIGGVDFGTPGAANDCGAGEMPQIVINEIIQNPSAVSDTNGEWFELYNAGADPVDINGWTIADNDVDSHVISNGGPLVISPGGYLVLGRNGDSGVNGGVAVDYVYSSYFLANGDDEVILLDGSMNEIDRVEYDGGPNFPDPTGASMSLVSPNLDNNVGANWCEATTSFGAGDLGTPGAINDCNGVVVINEIMQNPDVVFDSDGEWFELYNPSGSDIDINGWTIQDNDSDSHVISNGGPLMLTAGGYLVLGNNADSGTNGGVMVDYNYGNSFFLSNGADELVILDTGMVEFDRVEWDGGPAFPDPTGASMSLVNPALDNNVGGNWCESPTPFGDGDLGTPGAANNCGALPPPICGADDTVTLISAIQGTTDTSPLEGMVVEIEGIVVGDLQGANEFGGLFIQEEDTDADADPLTSEGIFVFTDLPASAGDLVRARGTVIEFFGLTELSPTTDLVICDTGATPPTPAMPSLPMSAPDEFEAIESMSVVMPQTLVINDNFNLWRFGEFTVSSIRRMTPTSVVAPGAPANALAAANQLDQLQVDDRRTGDNNLPPVNGQDDTNPFDAFNPVRNGQTVTGITGVMHYAFNAWRVQPTAPVIIDEGANLRTAAPAPVGGTLKAAAFNVLNFFTTIDTGASICGPAANQDCRGADSPEEYSRQLDKLVPAIVAVDADVLGLVELENNPSDSLQAIVDGVNAVMGAGTYDFIDTGTIGGDAIKVGFIYKPAAVTPEGAFAILDSSVDARFDDSLNRPALAQSFRASSNLGLFTPIVNHLKSKGCGGATGLDEDQGDGQGCYNATRTSAAEALRDWANTDPTGTGSDAMLILGDLNSYRMEDPIQTLLAGGFTSLELAFGGPDAYSYQFMGQKGSLDYALSSDALTPKITGATPWNINADETRALDYNTEFDVLPSFYAPTPYRTSDHDPIIVGMELNPPSSITIPTLADGVDAFVEVTTPLGDKCGFSAIEFVDPNSLATAPPANLVFPYGVLQFTVETCSVGTMATVSVTLPDIPDFLSWFKHTDANGWDVYPSTLNGSVFSFDVTDGGMGDEDGVANGIIIDPSGPAIVAAGSERATFRVSKDFDDDNPAEVAVTLSCNTGLPLEQTTMIAEGRHVEFVVGDFEVGTLNCNVSEVVPDGYAPNHAAAPGFVAIADQILSGETACEYIGVSNGQFLCQITNTLQEVDVTINKEWIDDNPGFNLPVFAEVQLSCSQAGFVGEQYISPSDPGVFTIFPHYEGETCTVTETPEAGVLQNLEDCDDLEIAPGQDAECTIVNTRLYEGIPTLSQYGLLILSLLMLMIGMMAYRRFV